MIQKNCSTLKFFNVRSEQCEMGCDDGIDTPLISGDGRRVRSPGPIQF